MITSDYRLLSFDPTGAFPVAKHTVTCTHNLATTADSEELAGMLYALDVVARGTRGPVLCNGELVGIVYRYKLLRTSASQRDNSQQELTVKHRQVQQNVYDALQGMGWSSHVTKNVIAADGVVGLGPN